MSGETALAAEELRRFFQNFRHIEAVCDRLRDLDDIENELARKRREHDTLLANLRAQAEKEAALNLEAREQEFEAKIQKKAEAAQAAAEMTIHAAETKAKQIEQAALQKQAEAAAKIRELNSLRKIVKEEMKSE